MPAANIALGLDVGAVGVKCAALMSAELARQVLAVNGTERAFRVLHSADGRSTLLVARYRRSRGVPLDALREVIHELSRHVPAEHIDRIAVTGSGGERLADILSARRCNGFQALARAVDLLCPEVRTVFEIGGESSKYLRLAPETGNGRLAIVDYSTNGDCAAGTGSFLDQQAGRLQYAVEDLGHVVQSARRCAQIAGRCSVFAKSDMIHAQQKGFTPPEVLRGLCQAVASNFRSAVVKGHTVEPVVALVGGVSANIAVVQALGEVFELADGELRVPPGADSYGAIGAAALAAESRDDDSSDASVAGEELLARLDNAVAATDRLTASAPLNLDRVLRIGDNVESPRLPEAGEVVEAFLGLDIGSVGTKLVVIDGHGALLHNIFTRTEGRPIEVVTRCLREIRDAIGDRIRIRGVGTTGSGRELIGELVGADSIHDEITAHKTGASFVGDKYLGKRPDTIFEIGGQDSKYISLQPAGEGSTDTIVVDFTMNEACAAGTGSFLEERAEELGVSIKEEFAALGLAARAPVKLGERCTVFMERDVNSYLQRGAEKADLVAGLAYSVVTNYINRVVCGRHVGECIFFQGGTAYNDAVAAAFSIICNKQIIIPPHNAVLGALGAALLAHEKMSGSPKKPRFRGWDMDQVDYRLREFTCKACGNQCAVQEFTVDGEKTYWGDKCSERFRKQVKTERKATIPDLIAARKELLAADDGGDPPDATRTIGIPLAMYAHDQLPFWRRFFRDCGLKVAVSSEPADHPSRPRVCRGRAVLPDHCRAWACGGTGRARGRLLVVTQRPQRRNKVYRLREPRLPLGPDIALRAAPGARVSGVGRPYPLPHDQPARGRRRRPEGDGSHGR
jgi:predicted CoA-substrate-specific enzyme activase